MQFSYDYFFETKKKVLDKYRRGEGHRGVRFITFIDKDNIDAVKNYLDAGAKIKHIRNLPPMILGVSDKEVLTTLDCLWSKWTNILWRRREKIEDGKVQNLLVSKDVSYIKYFADTFDESWDKGINARERIKDIEEGRETHDELADAKQYLNLVLEEVNKMKNKAAK